MRERSRNCLVSRISGHLVQPLLQSAVERFIHPAATRGDETVWPGGSDRRICTVVLDAESVTGSDCWLFTAGINRKIVFESLNFPSL